MDKENVIELENKIQDSYCNIADMGVIKEGKILYEKYSDFSVKRFLP